MQGSAGFSGLKKGCCLRTVVVCLVFMAVPLAALPAGDGQVQMNETLPLNSGRSPQGEYGVGTRLNVLTGLQYEAKVWSAKTPFGGFTFSLNPEKTQLSKLGIHMDGFTCGGVTVKGDLTANSNSLWPVKDNSFTIDTKLRIYHFIVRGSFNPDNDKAAGTWEIQTGGSVCSGTWETEN